MEPVPKSPPKSSPRKVIEWTKTPAFRQYVLKVSETESLEGSELGIRKYYQNHIKDKARDVIEMELDSKELRMKLIEEILASAYRENEVEYLLKIVKNKNMNCSQMREVYLRALDTLEL